MHACTKGMVLVKPSVHHESYWRMVRVYLRLYSVFCVITVRTSCKNNLLTANIWLPYLMLLQSISSYVFDFGKIANTSMSVIFQWVIPWMISSLWKPLHTLRQEDQKFQFSTFLPLLERWCPYKTQRQVQHSWSPELPSLNGLITIILQPQESGCILLNISKTLRLLKKPPRLNNCL